MGTLEALYSKGDIVKERSADIWVLEVLVNLSAAVAHILGTEGERPISAWAWRLGSRSLQYGVLAAFIALPAFLAVGVFLAVPFGIIWVAAWLACWACQTIAQAREWHKAYRRARKA